MKIAGKVPGVRRGVYVVKRGDKEFKFHLKAMAIGGWAKLAKRLGGLPQPPQVGDWLKLKGVLVRDENNQPIRKVDENDPAFVAAENQYHVRLNVAAFLECVELERSKIVFDAKLESDTDVGFVAYCNAVLEELSAAGITDGELVRIVKEISEMSTLKDEELEAATDDFLSP